MIDQIWKNNELSKEEGLTLEQAMPIVEDYMESLNIDVGSAGQEAILKNFAELDLDGNGQIDRDEMFRHLKKTKNLSSMIAENKANSHEQIEDNKVDEETVDVAQAEEKLPSEEEKVIVTESTQDPITESVPVKEKVEENETPVEEQQNQVKSAQSTQPVAKMTLDSSVKRRSGIVGQVLPGQIDHNKQTTDTAQVARLQYEVANCLEQMQQLQEECESMKTQIVSMVAHQRTIEKEARDSQKKISEVSKKYKKSQERKEKLDAQLAEE